MRVSFTILGAEISAAHGAEGSDTCCEFVGMGFPCWRSGRTENESEAIAIDADIWACLHGLLSRGDDKFWRCAGVIQCEPMRASIGQVLAHGPIVDGLDSLRAVRRIGGAGGAGVEAED